MITRQEFPYLQELVINDAYAVKGLRVPVFEASQEFKHLVLTGRNGSGKTTILKSIIGIMHGNIQKISAKSLVGYDQNVEAFFRINLRRFM